MDAKGSARFYCSAMAGAGNAAGFTPNHLDWPLVPSPHGPSRPGGWQASHVGSLPLQPRIVGSGNCVPGVHVPVHAHGDALLLGVVQGAAGLPDALPKALVRHPLQELLCVGHGDLHLHLLHDEPRVQLPPAASSGAEVGAEAALHAQRRRGPGALRSIK